MFLTSHPQYCDGLGNLNFGNISWIDKRYFRMRSKNIWQISKTWVHLYWMKTKTHLNDNLHQVSPLRRKQRQTHKCSEDKAGLEFTRTLVCSDWWWFIGEGLPEQESVTSSGYIIAPCTMHYLVPGQKDKQTDINRQKDRQTDRQTLTYRQTRKKMKKNHETNWHRNTHIFR